jgi:hypothetical protein
LLSDIEILAECTLAKVGESSEWTTIMNSGEENRANFCRALDGKPLFSALYGIYTVTMNELKAIMKVSAQAGQSRGVNKTSVESRAQNDDVWEVKMRKRQYSDNSSKTAKKSTISVPKIHVFISLKQSYADALRQNKQRQQPQAT